MRRIDSIQRLGLVLEVTNYDQGNAFLWFLLAGLGQIHIDGKLTLENSGRTEPLAKYEVNKTFAWGGILGGTTTIETVEKDLRKPWQKYFWRRTNNSNELLSFGRRI